MSALLLAALLAPTLFQGVRVFDGAAAHDGLDVLVEDGRIARVGRGLAPPAGARVVPGQGATLLPGLIDCHAHAHGPEHLALAAALGTTTVLDMGNDPANAAKLRRARPAGGAELRSAGTMITAPGGHGTEYGFEIPTLRSAAEAPAFVRARLAEGSDYLKVVLDDGRAYGIRWSTLDRATLEAVIAEAHRHRKLAVVHVGTVADGRAALEAGADGLAHLFLDPLDPGFVELAARKKAFVCPTLSVLRAVTGVSPGRPLVEDRRLAPYLADEARRNLGEAFPRRPGVALHEAAARETVRRLAAAGVDVLAGSDAPNPGTAHGATLHGELALLVEAGLTPTQALVAATSAPARRFGLADRGRVAPGLRADLLLVRGDPTRDIAATRDVLAVWVGGEAVDREALARQVAGARAERERRVAALPRQEPGLVSDFEDGKPSARFGGGWQVSTDALFGGKSRAELAVADGGAAGGRRALAITGTVVSAGGPAFAGAIFWPGPRPMTPVDLGKAREVVFHARGDGKPYAVMLFSQSRGPTPSVVTFTPGKAWGRHAFPISRFAGIDARELMGLFIGAVEPGAFALAIDAVELR